MEGDEDNEKSCVMLFKIFCAQVFFDKYLQLGLIQTDCLREFVGCKSLINKKGTAKTLKKLSFLLVFLSTC